ncbi:MAG: hypothetical protein JST87_15585 [Bacteroidetes bacterium]|nr:hypothetical protein [Bacteroidota bacterium]
MKKLKLKALEFNAEQVLTREQLRNVLGGDDGSGGDSCSMTYQDPSGQWHTEQGTCSVATYNVGYGDSGYTQFVPYCSTSSFPNPTQLSSNGGVSKCGNSWAI